MATDVTDSPAEEQAVKMNSPTNRMLGILFMGNIEYPSNPNTYGLPPPFL